MPDNLPHNALTAAVNAAIAAGSPVYENIAVAQPAAQAPQSATEPATAQPEPFQPAPRLRPLYVAMASACDARLRCQTDADKLRAGIPCGLHESFLPLREEWFERWTERLEQWTRVWFPSGSGFDSGTQFDFERSTGERLRFTTAFHHMDEYGSYDGWTEHTVTVRPSLIFGFTLSVSGRNRNQIKDYIADVFRNALDTVIAD